MPVLDLAVIAAYIIGTVAFGAWVSSAQQNVKDYFVSGRTVPWWAIMGSIVATETSTATFAANGRGQTDRVFPLFIVSHMPAGLMGLVVAAIPWRAR